jgi:hypothetical protein
MEDGADEEILGNVPYTYTLLNTLWHRAIIYLMKVKNGYVILEVVFTERG